MYETGKHLGAVDHGEPSSANMAEGGEDWWTLYFNNRHPLGPLQMTIPDVPVPAQR